MQIVKVLLVCFEVVCHQIIAIYHFSSGFAGQQWRFSNMLICHIQIFQQANLAEK